MSLADKLSGKRSQGRPAYQGDDVNRFYGDVWLLDQVALKTVIRQDLLTVFEGNAEMVNDILTLAFFPYLTGYTYNRLARWQRIARTPSREELTPTMITRLTQSITESERMKLFRLRAGRPDGMRIDAGTRIYHKQYDMEYDVSGKGGAIIKADRLKLNLYFDAVRRGEELTSLDIAIESQRAALQAIKDAGEPLDDDVTIKKNYNLFNIEYKASDRTLLSFTVNEKKVDNARRASGFFANMTLGVDMDAMQALDAYGLRDEQEKYFQQMKGQMGFDKQRCWSEEGKTGRLFVLFTALIISSYVRHIWKTTNLKDTFSSTHEMLDEMRSIRCIEHKGKARFITPFVGSQLDICKAFGFDVPQGCAPTYMSKKKAEKKPGRPKKTAPISAGELIVQNNEKLTYLRLNCCSMFFKDKKIKIDTNEVKNKVLNLRQTNNSSFHKQPCET